VSQQEAEVVVAEVAVSEEGVALGSDEARSRMRGLPRGTLSSKATLRLTTSKDSSTLPT